jgi:hypothetical protein
MHENDSSNLGTTDSFETQLQRLVDGELDTESIRSIIAMAEGHPNRWRSIACAFVEDQMFSRQFEQLANDRFEEAVALPSVKSASLPDGSGNSVDIESRNFRQPLVVRQLAFVASVAVAGLIGYLLAGQSNAPSTDINSPGSGVEIANSNPSEPVQRQLTPANLEPEYRMELLTPDGESINGEVDLYRYDDLRNFVDADGPIPAGRQVLNNVMPESGISDEDRIRLGRSGYEINESTKYVSGRLQDGRQFVVPVRSIRFDRGY